MVVSLDAEAGPSSALQRQVSCSTSRLQKAHVWKAWPPLQRCENRTLPWTGLILYECQSSPVILEALVKVNLHWHKDHAEHRACSLGVLPSRWRSMQLPAKGRLPL